MERRPDTIAARARGAAIACGLALALAVVMTWPLATGLGRLGRTTNDGRALRDLERRAGSRTPSSPTPASLFDANIFYPHREHARLLRSQHRRRRDWRFRRGSSRGIAYAAHNTALLFAFATSFLGMWLLARQAFGTRRHVDCCRNPLRVLPVLLLAQRAHSATDGRRHTAVHARAAPIGRAAIDSHAAVPRGSHSPLQALACAYYGIFAGLMVGYGVLFLARAPALVGRTARSGSP